MKYRVTTGAPKIELSRACDNGFRTAVKLAVKGPKLARYLELTPGVESTFQSAIHDLVGSGVLVPYSDAPR